MLVLPPKGTGEAKGKEPFRERSRHEQHCDVIAAKWRDGIEPCRGVGTGRLGWAPPCRCPRVVRRSHAQG